MLDENKLHNIDANLKRIISYGEKSLIVYRKVPYQMINHEDFIYMVKLDGFFEAPTKENIDLPVMCLPEDAPKLNRKICTPIPKADIVKAEIGGHFKDFFMLKCGELKLYIKNEHGVEVLKFRLPGEVNQFEVKRFLDGVENVAINNLDITSVSAWGLDENEPSTFVSLIKHFNNKARKINIVNGMLSVLSIILILFGTSPDNPYNCLIRGIAALLPLVIYANYLKYSRILRLVWSGGKEEKPYKRCKTECFIKIMLPTILLLMEEFFPASRNYETLYITNLSRYVVLSIIAASIMIVLFYRFTHEWREKRLPRYICAAMCFFYAFPSVSAVNKIYVGEPEVMTSNVVNKYVFDSQDDEDIYYYVVVVDGERMDFTTSKEEYDALVPEEANLKPNPTMKELLEAYYFNSTVKPSQVCVKKYRGILGIEYVKSEIIK